MAHHWGLIEYVYLISAQKRGGSRVFDYSNHYHKVLLVQKMLRDLENGVSSTVAPAEIEMVSSCTVVV